MAEHADLFRGRVSGQTIYDKFLYSADRASQYIYLNINQLDALNFIMSPLSTCAPDGHLQV